MRAARTVVAAAAVGSLGLMLRAGRHNKSWLLLTGMALWVISPFVILLLADRFSKRWPALKAALHCIMFAIPLASLAIYINDAFRPNAKAAFVYVLVPPVSWLLIGAVLGIAALLAARRE